MNTQQNVSHNKNNCTTEPRIITCGSFTLCLCYAEVGWNNEAHTEICRRKTLIPPDKIREHWRWCFRHVLAKNSLSPSYNSCFHPCCDSDFSRYFSPKNQKSHLSITCSLFVMFVLWDWPKVWVYDVTHVSKLKVPSDSERLLPVHSLHLKLRIFEICCGSSQCDQPQNYSSLYFVIFNGICICSDL